MSQLMDTIIASFKERRRAIKEIDQRARYASEVVKEVYASRIAELQKADKLCSDMFDNGVDAEALLQKMKEVLDSDQQSPEDEIRERLAEYDYKIVSENKE